ncbi:hypothetical protein BDW02DRAFT_492543 [Decorospora gaudefroyi]|uniref:Myb-like domain-containing protein n=1 Tax=Decorospora gaudefroyi TaxID=184978 RepID=A0A6A5KPD1_9PLEO|nr:hypothetical protein BDW02DRAFT_492543 [Decorospora gaudefroyi]
MADRSRVRSTSRRKTPNPQPLPKVVPSQGRASRRGLRSASREVEESIGVVKPAGRNARQAALSTVTDDSENEGQTTRITKRNPAKEALGDLTTVEEMDTQVALEDEDDEDAPGTPTRAQFEAPVSFRSPDAASEMSGTTAISSFSMVEAEFLEPRFILRHLAKLCDSTQEFLEHVAPDTGGMEVDSQNIQEMQKPGSDYAMEYEDFDDELKVHLKHFKTAEISYIHVRALHRTLFGANGDATASRTGLDLILYLTNLLLFAKHMLHSDRNGRDIWDALRELDITFPAQFMSSLVLGATPTATGESALLEDTFSLALELRTQLVILALNDPLGSTSFDPEEVLNETFLRSESSQAADGSLTRGWNMLALGGDDSSLPRKFHARVTERLNNIRQFFLRDEDSLKRGGLVDVERLVANFPWEPMVLRILHWVRLRHRELRAAIQGVGGADTIADNVKQAHKDPQPIVEQSRAPGQSQRRKRTSFGRHRQRGGRKSNPTAPLDAPALRALDELKQRERDSGVHLEGNTVLPDKDELENLPQPVSEGQDEPPIPTNQQDNQHPPSEDNEQQPDEQPEEQLRDPPEDKLEERSGGQPFVEPQIEDVEEQIEEPGVSGPPQSTAALLKALKAAPSPQKENRPVSIFDRQSTARRIEFGDGFDETQSTAGPSSKANGKQPAQPSPRKRPRVTGDEESDSEAFESVDRVPARVAKKVRINPTASSAPTSHQPPPRPTNRTQDAEQEESVSETEAPEMTEAFPPSSYRAQARLAKLNTIPTASQNDILSRGREAWAPEEEDAFVEYMRIYPCRWSIILQHDSRERLPRLQRRTQVNLKDKARNMAVNMVKSGTGLRPGFEFIAKPSNKDGVKLMAAGWIMQDDGEWVRANSRNNG